MCYLGFPINDPAPPERQEAGEPPKQHLPILYGDEFMMYMYKVVECDNPEHTRDDWDACPFAHVGEVVTRRPPQTHLPKLCPKARRACRKGRACPYAHNVFEHWLHPSRFKTEICQHGTSCMRPMCFFAHRPEEVRHPSPSADEVMAAAEAAGLLGRSHGHAHCGGSAGGALRPCYDACSRRSSVSMSSDLPSGFSRQTSWLADPLGVATPAAAAAAAALAAPQLYAPLGADLAYAAQCLRAQTAAQLQQAQAAAAAAAVAAAAAAASAAPAWAGNDWALLSCGSSSPKVLPASGDASPSSGAYGTPSPPLPPTATAAGRLGGAAPYELWTVPVSQPALMPGLSAQLRGTALSSDEALLLLAGIHPNSAHASLLCALQAEHAGAARTGAYY